VVCSACLKKLAKVPFVKRPAFRQTLRLVRCAFSILIAWFFFFLIGEMLLKIPASFHDGTIWRVNWMDQQ